MATPSCENKKPKAIVLGGEYFVMYIYVYVYVYMHAPDPESAAEER